MSLRAKVVGIMAFPVVVLIASASFGYVAERRSASLLDAYQHANQVQHAIDTVLADMVDAETGTRGYLLTGDETFLAPYERGSTAQRADLKTLRDLTSGNPFQAERISRLQILITDRLTTLVQLQAFAPVTARTDREDMIGLMNEGNGLMNTIRGVLEQMSTLETSILQEREAALEDSRHMAFLLMVVGMPGAVLLALAIVFVFAQRVVGRITKIEQNARRLESGEPLMDATPGRDEIGELGRVLVETGARLSMLQNELRRLATVDELTGLANRRGFTTVAEHELRLAERLGENLAVMFVDLDNLKVVNDTLGHAAGDEMLIEAAELLSTTFRTSDLPSRVGGDEFCILLTTAEDPGAKIAVSRLRERAARKNLEPGRSFELSFSVGMVEFDPANPQPLEALMEAADKKMYEEKRRRRAEREASSAVRA